VAIVADSAPAHLTPRHVHMVRLGLGLLLVSEVIVFVTLFSIRFLVAGSGHPSALKQIVGVALTLLMLLSVVPALDSLAAARRGDGRRLISSLLATLAVGVLVLVAIAVEWGQLDLAAGNPFGGIFLTASGFHAAHMLAAVLVLAGLAAQAARGRFSPDNHVAVEAGVAFWLFMVAVWIGLWIVFYLL
jgi:heme/copper-type cytochrome/quinol oxidase subunit 3